MRDYYSRNDKLNAHRAFDSSSVISAIVIKINRVDRCDDEAPVGRLCIGNRRREKKQKRKEEEEETREIRNPGNIGPTGII